MKLRAYRRRGHGRRTAHRGGPDPRGARLRGAAPSVLQPRARATPGRPRATPGAARAGETPDFLPNPIESRDPDWRVAPAPADLDDRRVEITGPAEPKMMINALNSGARSSWPTSRTRSPPPGRTWSTGQAAVRDAVRRDARRSQPEGQGVPPRRSDRDAAASGRAAGTWSRRTSWSTARRSARRIFDFGLCFFHNAARAARARLRAVLLPAQAREPPRGARCGTRSSSPRRRRWACRSGSIRATVLIETILAAFEMDEILYELRDHAAGLNAGRWDYIFSIIKKFRDASRTSSLPDRAQVTMTVPFMRAYTELLVQTCHRRGAHAIGGMAAFIPNRRDAGGERASAGRGARGQGARIGRRLRRHLGRPSGPRAGGHARSSTACSATRPNQKERLRPEVRVTRRRPARRLRARRRASPRPASAPTSRSALQYLDAWLARQRRGGDQQPDGGRRHRRDQPLAALAVARRTASPLDDGRPLTADRYAAIRDEELAKLRSAVPDCPWTDAAALLDELVLATTSPSS